MSVSSSSSSSAKSSNPERSTPPQLLSRRLWTRPVIFFRRVLTGVVGSSSAKLEKRSIVPQEVSRPATAGFRDNSVGGALGTTAALCKLVSISPQEVPLLCAPFLSCAFGDTVGRPTRGGAGIDFGEGFAMAAPCFVECKLVSISPHEVALECVFWCLGGDMVLLLVVDVSLSTVP